MWKKPAGAIAPIALIAILVISGCGQQQPDTDGSESSDTSGVGSTVTIVPGERAPAIPDAHLVVTSPGPDEVVASDSVLVSVDLQGFELGAPTAGEQSKDIAYSMDGQHIHVIIDNKPYMAMFRRDSFSVGVLSPGVHAIRAVLGRSWHECVKEPGAFVAHDFYVGKKTDSTLITEGQPLLTYSRPKGIYTGSDANRILLDFYVSNAQLGPDAYKVIASIDGQVIDTLTQWIPYYIENLPAGEHTVALQLIDPEGNKVPGPFNLTERKITVEGNDVAAATAEQTRYHIAAGPARP